VSVVPIRGRWETPQSLLAYLATLDIDGVCVMTFVKDGPAQIAFVHATRAELAYASVCFAQEAMDE